MSLNPAFSPPMVVRPPVVGGPRPLVVVQVDSRFSGPPVPSAYTERHSTQVDGVNIFSHGSTNGNGSPFLGKMAT